MPAMAVPPGASGVNEAKNYGFGTYLLSSKFARITIGMDSGSVPDGKCQNALFFDSSPAPGAIEA